MTGDPDDLFYCPSEFQYCGVVSHRYITWKQPPICQNGARTWIWMQQLWRTTLLLWILFFILVVCSESGRGMVRNMVLAILGLCIPSLTKWRVERMIGHQPGHANRLILQHLRREEEQLEIDQARNEEEEEEQIRPWWRVWGQRNGSNQQRFFGGAESERLQILRIIRDRADQGQLLVRDPEMTSYVQAMQEQEEKYFEFYLTDGSAC